MFRSSAVESLFDQVQSQDAQEPTESAPEPVEPVDPTGPTDPAPAGEGAEEPALPKAPKDPVLGQKYPDLSSLTTVKVPHKNLILDGVCTHCAHCGQQLTDAVSIQRGIGPVCSKRGYSEDPVDGDEMQAMIDLAEFQELAEFLTEHYRPLGIRGLVNGLVRAASLNRPRGRGQSEGNYKVHAACCDAIESLGHKKLANLLRDTLVVVSLQKCKPEDPEAPEEPGWYRVVVKKRDAHPQWQKILLARLKQVRGRRFDPTQLVRLYRDSEEKLPVGSEFWTQDDRGVDRKATAKRALWELILYCYEGMVMKGPDGKNIRIKRPA